VTDGHGGSILAPAAVDVVRRSVLQHCGGKGPDEGLVTDPSHCAWLPSMAACPSGGQREDCLTPAQVRAIDRLMTSPTNSRGDVIYRYPYLPGTETEWAGWNFAAIRAGRLIPEFGNFKVADQYLKYLADAAVRADVDVLRFDFDRDPATLTRARALYDATSPNLAAFKARGGKLRDAINRSGGRALGSMVGRRFLFPERPSRR
jgi:tannase/feruloyl esterase